MPGQGRSHSTRLSLSSQRPESWSLFISNTLCKSQVRATVSALIRQAWGLLGCAPDRRQKLKWGFWPFAGLWVR